MKRLFIIAFLVLSMACTLAEGGEIKFKARISFCNWNDKRQCPNEKTASGKKPQEPYCAVSKDLISRFNLQFGQPLLVTGYGRVVFQCVTGNYYKDKHGRKRPIKNTLDIYKGKNVWRCFQAEVTIAEWK